MFEFVMFPLLLFCSPQATLPQVQPTRIDSVALMEMVAYLAADERGGRATGTSGNEDARQYIVAQLRRMGVSPIGEDYTRPFSFTSRRDGDRERQGINVVGVIPGTTFPEQYIVVSAHYDHLGIRDGVVFNGADDNASGVAGMLAIAQDLVANRPRHSVVIAALDAEELGLQGARAFTSAPPVELPSVRLNVNLDMISRSADTLHVAGPRHYPFLRTILMDVVGAAEVTLVFGHDDPNLPRGEDWTHASDHGPFHDAGIPFVYFGVEDHPDYHRSTDDVMRIDPSFYVKSVRSILLSVRALDASLASYR